MSVPVLALLAFAVWTILVLLTGVGVRRWSLILTGRAQLKEFPADEAHGGDAYRRAMRAHANCVENLPVFGAVVLAIEASGVASQMLDLLAMAVVAARVLQTLVHWTSGSNAAIGVRFAFFAVQLFAMLAMAWIVARTTLGW